jgi:hypothetical protein
LNSLGISFVLDGYRKAQNRWIEAGMIKICKILTDLGSLP